MKCLSCDTILSDAEATRKFSVSGEFVDLCDDCFVTISDDVSVMENSNLREELDQNE